MPASNDWRLVTDEAHNYAYARVLPSVSLDAYEVVAVRHHIGCDSEYRHMTVFVNEYNEDEKNGMLDAFGYERADYEPHLFATLIAYGTHARMLYRDRAEALANAIIVR